MCSILRHLVPGAQQHSHTVWSKFHVSPGQKLEASDVTGSRDSASGSELQRSLRNSPDTNLTLGSPLGAPRCELSFLWAGSALQSAVELKIPPVHVLGEGGKLSSLLLCEVSDSGLALWNLWSCLHPSGSPVPLVDSEPSSRMIQQGKGRREEKMG